jgi:hypothetical protein
MHQKNIERSEFLYASKLELRAKFYIAGNITVRAWIL